MSERGIEKPAPRKGKGAKIVVKNATPHERFKCRSCEKLQNCYGSRYCQNEFNPVSLVTDTRHDE